ncbi:MAG: penicillin-binding protein 1C [Bacteroidia bacterium]
MLDKNGILLGARIAEDEQWRFPERTVVPEKFRQCLIQFEDRNFYYHPGFNPVAFARAMQQNISSRKIVSGGSTITMQVIRMAEKNPPRTLLQKLKEIILATRLELRYGKDDILALYASHAPYGSNVVGIDAASWRYFGRSPEQLSWAESATLAVLPNAPSLIYPGKNQEKLKNKRDRLLKRLFEAGIIDRETFELSCEEPLPGTPYPLPRLAPHLLDRAAREGHEGTIIYSTIDAHLQEQLNGIIDKHHRQLAGNEIHNAAAIIIDVETGNTLAYCGNTEPEEGEDHGNAVDCANAPRSTGSILKPFLYATMLSEGELLPNMLVADIPTDLSGYNPENFNLTYDGAVPASRALARSLNIPAVKMLQQYKVDRLHNILKKTGMTTLFRKPDEYGLSLILGGAEGKLWDLAGMYASMARTLQHYNSKKKYTPSDFHAPHYMKQRSDSNAVFAADRSWYDASAIWFTFESMVEVSRPDEDANWKQFSSAGKIAWKTGTSFGFRDGWAIGVTPQYVVGVWVGNADGEGRPGLTGIKTAAPILFDIFGRLPHTSWFSKPESDMQKVKICKAGGHRALDICESEMQWIPKSGLKTPPCPYHRIVHLDMSGQYRVNSDCENVANIRNESWFVLPPSMEYYYKTKNPSYKTLPPYREGCVNVASHAMDFVYPREETKLFIPIELNGRPGQVVFEVAHRKPGAIIYWHLDDVYMGETSGIHQMAMRPDSGPHKLTCVDENGETISMNLEIVGERK